MSEYPTGKFRNLQPVDQFKIPYCYGVMVKVDAPGHNAEQHLPDGTVIRYVFVEWQEIIQDLYTQGACR